MSELNEHVLEEAGSRGDKLIITDLVGLIERHDGGEESGVTVDRVVAYAERLAAQNAPVDPDKVPVAIDERLTDADRWQADAAATGTWFGSGVLYGLDDRRVSVFPSHWHEELAGETDLRRYLTVICADLEDPESAFESGGQGVGVPETVLLNAAAVIGRVSRREAGERLAELRAEGVVEELADQHPNARVRLAE